MTKTSRLIVGVVAVTGVAWLGVACGPQEEPEPEATATVAAEPAPGMAKQPIWKQCMKNEDDCVTGVRVQVGTKDGNKQCQVFLQSWFSEPSHRIKVYSKGRVFFLVQWQEECEGMRVRLTHTDGHPWEGSCHEEAWVRPDGQSFTSVPCEIREHSDHGPDQWTDYLFDLQIEPDTPSPAHKTGGTVRVRGSGRPPANVAPAS